MKMILFTFFFLYLTPLAQALELTLKTDPKTVKKFNISKLHGIQVNSECIRNKSHCLKLLSQEKIAVDNKRSDGTIGNPASDYCHSAGGSSEILEDKKHNEYDYCVFEDKYYVDSWDFYKKYKR